MQVLQFHQVLSLELETTRLHGPSAERPSFAATDLIVRHNTLDGPVETRIGLFADTPEQLLLAPQPHPADPGPQEEDGWAEHSGQLALDFEVAFNTKP